MDRCLVNDAGTSTLNVSADPPAVKYALCTDLIIIYHQVYMHPIVAMGISRTPS